MEGDYKENKWRMNNRKYVMQESDGEKVTVEKEGIQWDIKVEKYMRQKE